jgi:hypothetical protein
MTLGLKWADHVIRTEEKEMQKRNQSTKSDEQKGVGQRGK